jgi:putative adhesin
MPVNCENCGTELFVGQRFCRACGRPTEQFTEEHAPTLRMPEAADARRGRPVDTAPPASPQTSPVYPPLGYYQTPPAPQPAVPGYSQPGRSHGPLGWIIALLIAGFIAVVILMGVVFGIRAGRNRANSSTTTTGRQTATFTNAGESILGEENAVVDSGETRIAKTFTLGADARLSLDNVKGDIKIEGWDKPAAELEVVKSGGSAQDRRNVPVFLTNDANGFGLRSAVTAGRVSVDYVLRIPRTLKQITIKLVDGEITLHNIKADLALSSQNGSIDVSNIEGQITANTVNGSIDLKDITGSAAANTVNGDTKVSFDKVMPAKPLIFKSVSGDIELVFKSDVNLDLSAATAAGGDIEIDNSLGVEVQKKLIGQRAIGPIGTGGQPLKINTVSGNIRLTREQ